MTIKLHIWYQIKGPIIIFHMKGHAVKLKCVNYKNFLKKTWFLPKNAFLKLENMHNFDTYFHPLRNIRNFNTIIIRWIDIQEVVFCHVAIVSFFEVQNVTLLTVTLLTMTF